MRVLPFLALAACGADPLTAATYNAGLAVGFVPAAVERTDPTAAAIAGLEADVVCLQEVWQDDQVAAVEAAAAAAYPHTYFPAPQQADDTGTPSCPDGEIDSLVECAETNCGDVCDDELVDCVFSACALPFLGLEKPCQECVMAEVGNAPADIQATCEARSPGYAYGGSFGIGILSKHPIVSTDDHVFASTTNRRMATKAVIDGPNGEFEFTCTHLSAVFSVIPYPKEEGSWAEEQAAQIAELVTFAGSPDHEVALVAGDMNTGPAFANGVPEVPENYALFTDAGWTAPFATSGAPCTFCTDNPLNAGGDGESVLIDHIFEVAAPEGDATTARLLDGTIDTTSCGAPLTAAYSDHYGVAATWTP